MLIHLKNQNFSKYTIESTNKHLTRISKKADLNKPEQVTEYIANLEKIYAKKILNVDSEIGVSICTRG